MSFWRVRGWVGLATLVIGCGGSAANRPAPVERCVGARAEEMSFAARRDRHQIRNLENEVALLRAQLHDVPVGVQGPPASPAPPQGIAPEAAAAQVAAPPPLAPGVSSDAVYGETEIVYEGEAARQVSARPRIELHETTRTAQGLADSAAGEPPVLAPLAEVGSERLPVVSGRIPRVDEQLRSARTATATAGGGFAVRPGADRTQDARADAGATPRAAAPSRVGAPVSAANRVAAPVTATAPAPAVDRVFGPVPASVPPAAAIPAPGPAASAAPAPPSVAMPVIGPPGAGEPQSDPTTDYRRALGVLRRGQNQRAASSLRAFLEHFPRHHLADNVQYFLAESYYRRQQYKTALVEYQRVLRRYWRGNKVPAAMLKIALCQIALGRTDAARASLERLIARAPQSKHAELARAKLQELDHP